jgi:hypothetical protein
LYIDKNKYKYFASDFYQGFLYLATCKWNVVWNHKAVFCKDVYFFIQDDRTVVFITIYWLIYISFQWYVKLLGTVSICNIYMFLLEVEPVDFCHLQNTCICFIQLNLVSNWKGPMNLLEIENLSYLENIKLKATTIRKCIKLTQTNVLLGTVSICNIYMFLLEVEPVDFCHLQNTCICFYQCTM